MGMLRSRLQRQIPFLNQAFHVSLRRKFTICHIDHANVFQHHVEILVCLHVLILRRHNESSDFLRNLHAIVSEGKGISNLQFPCVCKALRNPDCIFLGKIKLRTGYVKRGRYDRLVHQIHFELRLIMFLGIRRYMHAALRILYVL